MLLQLFESINSDIINTEAMVKLFRQEASVIDSPKAKPLILKEEDMEFKDVIFIRNGGEDQRTLDKVSFHYQAGQTAALIRKSGDNKSTCLNLLLHFYDVTRGHIKIDRQNIRGVTIESLQDLIRIIPQDPQLFNNTILENIRYTNKHTTDQDIYKACKAVELHNRFISLPEHYHTVIEKRGVKLSGNERQRLAIARVLVKKNTRIFLLDEATSAINNETKAFVQRNLSRLTAG
ncbi:P-loop containing nucleoside triphosphate hydrolase protein [Talaromyces proteolyticus]|uniref:P-loop containing nucleoside triphosphate hydrolase protein n=1 Tax=Talaromyces proteolyticus TaxID=1131652 RepID=A0AAD4KNY6_9EURO|nr:P-loop containing nucleoside triphosphate hydrolase protein [Talaromyces proteolyticus]KAH8695679.1 P-loop containing nucleoside triphosphate hydrolase protein [Talaromyces proteolyticus]